MAVDDATDVDIEFDIEVQLGRWLEVKTRVCVLHAPDTSCTWHGVFTRKSAVAVCVQSKKPQASHGGIK